ncbi:MAG: hypothetical protein KKB22_07510 [Candidatus Omnitrophica bacterium]|nr:hypothetical protein [Candidatus Omnitrophota bacterium]
MNNLVANLIVFVLLGGVLTFVISIVIHSRRLEKKEKEQKALNTKSKDGNK